MADALPEVTIESRDQWRSWLAAHHATSQGIWLVTYKKGSGRPQVSYDDIVDEALAFGWIDSRPGSIDEHRARRLLTPRKPTSNWSRRNKQRVDRLTRAGLMAPAGRAAVERARRNGSWSALDAVEELREPDDLREALDRNPRARGFWDAFPRSAKRAILEWIENARRPDTRSRRVKETVDKAADNVRANQWRQPGNR